MAGVSTKDIKQRIRSMESTRQITRAMEMVAASKLRHAQDRIRDSRPYFEILYGTIAHIACTRPDFFLPYLTRREGKRVCCIVIAGDRGLAGGYNNNMFKLVQQELGEKELSVLPMGKRAVEHFRGRGVPLLPRPTARRPMSPLVTASPCPSSWPKPIWPGVRRNFCGLYQFCLSSVPNSGHFAAAPSVPHGRVQAGAGGGGSSV